MWMLLCFLCVQLYLPHDLSKSKNVWSKTIFLSKWSKCSLWLTHTTLYRTQPRLMGGGSSRYLCLRNQRSRVRRQSALRPETGQSKKCFLAQLDQLFSPDGYYMEGPYYHRFPYVQSTCSAEKRLNLSSAWSGYLWIQRFKGSRQRLTCTKPHSQTVHCQFWTTIEDNSINDEVLSWRTSVLPPLRANWNSAWYG